MKGLRNYLPVREQRPLLAKCSRAYGRRIENGFVESGSCTSVVVVLCEHVSSYHNAQV